MTSTTAPEPFPGVTFAATIWGDTYSGTVDALLAADVVQPHQLPGAPGNGSTMVSFCPDGSRVGRGQTNACRQTGYLQVKRIGVGRLCVLKGMGETEQRRRLQANQDEWRRVEAEQAARARCWPFPIICGEPPQ